MMKGEWADQLVVLQQFLDVIDDGRQMIEERRAEFVDDAAALARLSHAASWTEQAHAIIRTVAGEGQARMEERWVWELILGVKKGIALTALAAILLFYNLARALLTYQMSSLRDNEERTGDSPARKDYWWLWRVHQVAHVALLMSIVSGAWRIGEMMFSVVIVPV